MAHQRSEPAIRGDNVVIVGGGPAGVACAIELQREGISALIVEKGCVAQTLTQFPTYMRFFTSPEGLELAGMPMECRDSRPGRMEAIAYYHHLVLTLGLHVRQYEKALDIIRCGPGFVVRTTRTQYKASKVILATGFFDHPVRLGIPGEDQSKVMHYYHEPHAYFDQRIVVIGGRNSAGAAALELLRAGAHVTIVHRKPEFTASMKPWLREELKTVIDAGLMRAYFESNVREVLADRVLIETRAGFESVPNDFVFALTGYEPDMDFLRCCGVVVNSDGRPLLQTPSLESSVPGIYLAGVIVSGRHTNELNISHAREHAERIAVEIASALRDRVA